MCLDAACCRETLRDAPLLESAAVSQSRQFPVPKSPHHAYLTIRGAEEILAAVPMRLLAHARDAILDHDNVRVVGCYVIGMQSACKNLLDRLNRGRQCGAPLFLPILRQAVGVRVGAGF